MNMDAFKGNYTRISEEKYEEMLQVLGVNYFLRKAACASTPTIDISEEGGFWTIKSSTTMKTVVLKFKLDEKFDESTPDGREVSSLATFADGKLKIVQTAKKAGQKSTTSVREMVGDELLYTITVDGSDVVCVQKFKKN